MVVNLFEKKDLTFEIIVMSFCLNNNDVMRVCCRTHDKLNITALLSTIKPASLVNITFFIILSLLCLKDRMIDNDSTQFCLLGLSQPL